MNQLTALMAVDALKDRNEIRKFVDSRSGDQVFGEAFNAAYFNPTMLSVTKSNGLYFVSKGYLAGYPISGTNRTVNLQEGSKGGVIYKIFEEYLKLSPTSGYFTGNYNILSAEFVIAPPGTPTPQDQVTTSVSNRYLPLFLWTDKFLNTTQLSFYILLQNSPILQNN